MCWFWHYYALDRAVRKNGRTIYKMTKKGVYNMTPKFGVMSVSLGVLASR